MNWTDLHARLFGQAFERVLGRPEQGAMAFARCLTPEVVEALANDATFAPEGWEALRVADTADDARRTITSDGAVERRETKAGAIVLLVDTERAGAGMDGIYSAAREVDEAVLFEQAQRLAGAEVAQRLSDEHRRYAERAIRAARVGRSYRVPPWAAFDYLCRIAAHGRHPGAYLHLLGLWPVPEADGATNQTSALERSRQFVDCLLGASAEGLTIPARIETLRLAALAPERKHQLEQFLYQAESKPLLAALADLADQPRLWAEPSSEPQTIQAIELQPWRSANGRILKWSGLVDESTDGRMDPPAFILKREAAASGQYSTLTVKWKARPSGIQRNAVNYHVAVVTDLDEDPLAERNVAHATRREQTCRFGDDDFSSLTDDSVVSAKVTVSVVDDDTVKPQDSEEFSIRFGDPPERTASGVGREVRTFSEGVVELNDRELVSTLAANPVGATTKAKGFVLLCAGAGQHRRSFRVFRPDLLSEVEEEWVGRSGAIGHWQVRVRASGDRAGPVEFVPFDGDLPDRTKDASRRMAERFGTRSGVNGEDTAGPARSGGGGVAQIYDDQAKGFETVKEYVLAWTAALDGVPGLAVCNTIEVLSLSGRTIGLIVPPAHPLRVAWLAAYDNLVLHTAFTQEQLAAEVVEECRVLDGAMFPAFLPNPAGGAFVFADTLGFHAVGMVPDSDPEPKAAVAILARALGEQESPAAAPSLGTRSAEVLGQEVCKYLDCHDTTSLLRVHALRPGDGMTIARALGHVDRSCRDAAEKTTSGDDVDGADDQPAAAPVFSLDLYPSASQHDGAPLLGQRDVIGRFIADLRERRRSGAGTVSVEDRWMLESQSLPGRVNRPRLRWARKRASDPETAAHLAVAFDMFDSRVVPVDDASSSRPVYAFGLMACAERVYAGGAAPAWRRVMRPAKDGQKHPSERSHTERLTRLDQTIQRATARHLGSPDGLPVLKTELSSGKTESLRTLHRLSDWVITLDRNAGIEYFDSPRDNRTVYDTYVIDCVPEHDDLGCQQLITSTGRLDEMRALIEGSSERIGLSSDRAVDFLLENLKPLSGRVAMRLTGSRLPTSDLFALAAAHAMCRTGVGASGCWTPLGDGFLVPVDEIRELLAPALDGNDGRRAPGRDPDLIYVSVAARKGLLFRFVDVTYGRHLRTVRLPDTIRAIHDRIDSFRARWMDWWSCEVPTFRAIRRARLARVLRFYADKASRHHLFETRYREILAEIDRMIERGGDYAFPAAPGADRGWVFCPEYAGRDPLKISPADWGSQLFLFGPRSLPDPDVCTVPPIVIDERSDDAPLPRLPFEPADADPDQTASSSDLTGADDGAATRGDAAVDPVDRGSAIPVSSAAPSVCLGTNAVGDAEVGWPLTIKGNPHLLIAGLPGMGKTTCLVGLCAQMVAAGIQPLVFSYHQDIDERLSTLVDRVRFIDVHRLGFNPLAVTNREAPTAHLDVAGSLRDIFSAIFPDLGDLQCERIRASIKESFVEAGWSATETGPREPDFKRFVELLRSDPKPDRGLQTLLARFGELEDYGFFDVTESRESLWDGDRPIVIRIHTTQNETLQRAFASLVFYGLYKDMFRRGIQARITHALIFDEAHRAAGLKLIPTMAKECRKYGISLVLASQEAKDFNASLFSAIANYLVLRLTEADAKALVRNVATAQQERTLIDRIKQMHRFKALYFSEGRQRPASVNLRNFG